jgi:transcription termination factor Rho
MNYSENELYKMNIMQLREVGKSMFIKGTTNKRKDELIENILHRSNKRTTMSNNLQFMSQQAHIIQNQGFDNVQKQLADELFYTSSRENTLPGAHFGLCFINQNEYLCKVYSTEGKQTDVVLNYNLIRKENLEDGDLIEFKQSMHNGQKYVSAILSVNLNMVRAKGQPVRRLIYTQKVFEVMLENAKKTSDSMIILPFATYDEVVRINTSSINSITSDVMSKDRNHSVVARLTAARLMQKVTNGSVVNAFVDLDRLLIAFNLTFEQQESSKKVIKFFASAFMHSDENYLNIIGLTNSSAVTSTLKSFSNDYQEM